MKDSVEAVFRREASYVHRTLLRLGVAVRDAEDGVQDVFIAVHRRWTEQDHSRPLRPWLFAFAFNYAANYRRLGRHRHEAVSEAVLAHEDHPERAYAQAEARSLVLGALEAVPLERRAVLVACDLDRFSAPEVADQLGLPLGTVYSRLRVAREEFAREARRLTAREP